MNEQLGNQTELLSRLELIETMMQEGRKSTEYWGWSQVLWGAAYLIAIGWTHSGFGPQLAWPITMMAALAITIVVSSRKRRVQPPTTVARALRGIWSAVGMALFIYCFSIGISGHFEGHTYLAGIEILLGVAYFACAMVLRWRTQIAVAIVWWAAAVATCFAPDAWVIPILVAATLIGMIGFGLYLMYSERRDRKRSARHA